MPCPAIRLRISSASRSVICLRHIRLAVKVGVVEVVGNALQNRFAQFLVGWDSRERQSNRPSGRCRYRQRQSTVAGDAADQQRRRTADRGQRNLAERRTPPQGRERDIDLPQQIARREHVALVAGDEIGDGHFPFTAVGLPDGADAVERCGERDHRPRRQRHADIAADGRRLPYLEGGEERAAALVDQRGGDPFRGAGQRIELGDRAGRCYRKFGLRDGERRPFQVSEIDQPAEMDLRFREQPGPAREPSIACRPNGQLVPRRRMRNRANGVQVHG